MEYRTQQARSRRSSALLAAVFFYLLSSISYLLLPLAAQSPSWPQFRGAANLSGVSSERFDPPLKVLWTYKAC